MNYSWLSYRRPAEAEVCAEESFSPHLWQLWIQPEIISSLLSAPLLQTQVQKEGLSPPRRRVQGPFRTRGPYAFLWKSIGTRAGLLYFTAQRNRLNCV